MFLSFLGTNFMLLSDQMSITARTLEMSITLARLRDPIRCSHTQLIGRIWLWVQYWSPGEHQSILGILFANIDFKFWNDINSVFTQFNLFNPFEWTLVLLVCSYICHGELTNGITWTLYKKSLCSWYRFRVYLRNKYSKSPYFEDFDVYLGRYWYYVVSITFIYPRIISTSNI